jgi:hypothetical protein
MKSNEIHILWSDYLHKTNPGTTLLELRCSYFVVPTA